MVPLATGERIEFQLVLTLTVTERCELFTVDLTDAHTQRVAIATGLLPNPPQAFTNVLCGSRAVLNHCVGGAQRTVAHSAAQRELCGSTVLTTELPGMNESTLGEARRGWANATRSLGAASRYFNLTVLSRYFKTPDASPTST